MSLAIRRLNPTALQKWIYSMSGFNQYGLMRDDILYITPEVDEALRRLPKHLLDERNFRIIRAMQVDSGRRVLPKEQWTKLEDDVLYLHPYLEEVLQEKAEREKWNAE
ncbi:cytochrome b-c1 complex subunit 7-like [Hylaeus anthracinus]|uniref:cytochrome b-c1 complex subunit 7-like n=1 Tax=Hylaeus anthracinus TaxID=313031 RepID=UPI0023B8D9FF|nr:cytochrome b-c1 complex subunit 7-like [Hylaeus anthracinus]